MVTQVQDAAPLRQQSRRKTKYMKITRNVETGQALVMNGTQFEEVNCLKYLGVSLIISTNFVNKKINGCCW